MSLGFGWVGGLCVCDLKGRKRAVAVFEVMVDVDLNG